MRILWLSLILMFSFQPKHERLVIIEKEITVSGNTSLGKFECGYNIRGVKDTLSFVDNKSAEIFSFDIAVSDFACGNFLLNNDFRKTIKAKEYPQAYVKVAKLRKNKNNYSCDLHLELAGKQLLFKDFQLSDSGTELQGNLTLDFETLDLNPPSKLGGLVKVEQMLSLSLSLAYNK